MILPHPSRPLFLSRRVLPSIALALACTLAPVAAMAQGTPQNSAQNSAAPSNSWSQEEGMRIVNEVQKRLGNMSNYSVWDWITFGIQGKTIVLKGYASRPIVKSDAGNLLKKIKGVEGVDNQIAVLPLSSMDDRIRVSVYNRIYTYPSLRIYNANQGSLRRAVGPIGDNNIRMGGGVINFPPIGFHAIHIIVRNGHVALYGVVNNESDKSAAGIQANTAPGVFSVDNDLMVENPKKK